MQSLRRASKAALRSSSSRRCMQTSTVRQAVSNLAMPAMSPTMTEGGITAWKKKEGEAFAAGDVLLEIETDKATIDVEAQDDGILGKILVQDGAKNIPVGQLIALLAEEGDDISNLQPPAETAPASPPPSASSSQPPSSVPDKPQSAPSAPKQHVHTKSSRPLFPSVMRLLQTHGVEDADKIKGTGVRGMLTKGDVLAYLGKASGPLGTYKEPPKQDTTKPPTPKKEEPKALDGAAIRQLIVNSMLQQSLKAQTVPAPPADFDSIIADYLPAIKVPPSSTLPPAAPTPAKPSAGYLDGLF